MNSYNRIAPVYDLLSRMIFGDKLLQAQKAYLPALAPGSRILFLGGGTGKILNTVFSSVENIHIDYIEPSQKMLQRAQQHLSTKYGEQIKFINGTQADIPAGKKYDAVFTFFVFDIFKQTEAEQFASAVNGVLKQDAVWLFADFFNTKNMFQRFLLWFMYRFFRISTRISADHLPDQEAIFLEYGWKLCGERSFMDGFVRSRLYKR